MNLTMEEVMMLSAQYDGATGLPKDADYFERDLQSSINVTGTEQIISLEQAWYLREKKLGLERTDPDFLSQ